MSIKFKHCCSINEYDYIEVDRFGDTIKVVSYDSNLNTEVELLLDKKTAIRFAKSVRTEINKIL